MENQKQAAGSGTMNAMDLRAQLAENHAASFGWAMNCCQHNRVEAEDALQNAYLKILQGRARYHGQAAFKTWLFAVIRLTAADERRRRWFRGLKFTDYLPERQAQPVSAAELLPLEQAEQQAALQAALSRLPRRQQEILHLVFYQDLSIEEAAKVMGVGLGSARTHYERGKQSLRERLPKEFGYED
jgi:RNA polymerase sigma-70 factor (ECF subfamily)